MPAVKDNILVGLSAGRFVLTSDGNDVPVSAKYLSESSSIILWALLSTEDEQIKQEILKTAFPKLDASELRQKNVKLLDELKDYLCDGNGDNRISIAKLKISKSRESALGHSAFRLDYPVKLVVIPTWKCNRECGYCGVPKIKPSSSEDVIEPELMLERLLDAVNRGVQHVTYHGGEPIFFYNGLFEQIRALRQRNVGIQLSTKNYISQNIANRLADAGLSQLQLSIDTVNPKLCSFLYNEEAYPQHLSESIANLLDVGIRPRINVVVSKFNYRGIPDLLFFLNNQKVRDVRLSNFRNGCINDKKLGLSKEEWAWLYRAILKNQRQWEFEVFMYSPFGEIITPASQRAICESGRVNFVFLPNGDGCFCDFLCENPTFHVGNLKKQTVGDIWDSAELNSLVFPDEKQFSGSCCADCHGLKHCIERGICYVGTEGNFTCDYKCAECPEGEEKLC